MIDHGSLLLPRLMAASLAKRGGLTGRAEIQAYRAFSGQADGLDGIYLDLYGPAAALIEYEGRAPAKFNPAAEAVAILPTLAPLGVSAIYHKPFAKDRSRLGGELPPVVTESKPLVGEPVPEFLLVREADRLLEVRLYDGLSTGLFLDQRDNRTFVADWVASRKESTRKVPTVLNTFAYTCAFSVAAALSGAATTSVDVSPRYLEWGKRNFTHNGFDPAEHRFAKMDTFEFFAYARRKGFQYDLIVLDPPSFASGSKKKGIRPWNSVDHYAKLVGEAAALLTQGGTIFASTNTQELCRPGRLEREIVKGLRRTPKWLKLPPVPEDFAREQDRFAARAFSL